MDTDAPLFPNLSFLHPYPLTPNQSEYSAIIIAGHKLIIGLVCFLFNLLDELLCFCTDAQMDTDTHIFPHLPFLQSYSLAQINARNVIKGELNHHVISLMKISYLCYSSLVSLKQWR